MRQGELGARVQQCVSRALFLSGSASGALEQTPEGGQEDGGQGEGGWDGKAGAVAEVILATGGGGRMLGVAIIHSLEAAGHAGLADLHPGGGVVGACSHAVGNHSRAAHGVEAVVSVVGTHMAVQGVDWGQR